MEIDEEIKAKLELLSATIVSALKESGNIYVPRTETGNYIIDGKVTKLKRGDKNGNR